jgi:hypothetical protein
MITPNTKTTGSAIWTDLYKEEADPKGLAGEARKLGLGFFVVFCAFFGGVSMALNQGTAKEPVVSFANAGDVGPVDSAGLFVFEWFDGSKTPAEHVLNAPVDWKEFESKRAQGYAGARLIIDRDLAAVLMAPEGPAPAKGVLQLKSVHFAGGSVLPAAQGYVYAWENAHLARVIPTRAFVLLGAVLGVLCFLPPIGGLIYTGWMGYVAKPLAWINTRLILTIVFAGMFVPMALVLAIKRAMNPEGDALSRALRPKDQSYWLKREIRDRKHFERWF